MSASPDPSRNPGLDTLRALAIALVFVYHYAAFVSGRPTFGWPGVVGWSGVDLFFVLSGYLIANPLFAGMVRGRTISVPAFMARRALRTLPVFWLVLAAFFLWPQAMGGRTPPPLWRFLTFTQNLGLQPGTAFSHAWSLCIEEQSYVALPLVLAGGAWLAGGLGRLTRWHGWALVGGLVVLGVAARCVRWFHVAPSAGGDPRQFSAHIYYATLCRFDELLPGVAVAMLRNFHPHAWARLVARGRAAGALGLAGALAILWLAYVESDDDVFGFFMTGFGYSLLAMSWALLVVAALSPATPLRRVRVPGTASLALWSYSIYLSHKPLAHVLKGALQGAGLGEYALAAVITVACVVVGALLHHGVERPFLRLRDRLMPSNFRAAAPAPAGAVAPI
jgi:peptidoglycan/LPS O-acetylase OafA/YrhL